MQRKAKTAIEMKTVTHFPTLMRRRVSALLMFTVWGYMTTAEAVESSGIALLLLPSTTLLVEAFSTSPEVNEVFFYIFTFNELNCKL